MNSLYHSKITVKRFGGKVDDYLKIHEFIDSSKVTCADHRHRALLHHTFGIDIACKLFGSYVINSDGKEVPVREILEEHIIHDVGFLPSADKYLGNIRYQTWFSGKGRSDRGKNKTITY